LIPFLLEIAPEPKHEWFRVGEAWVEQVVDDSGQELTPLSARPALAHPRVGAGRLTSFAAPQGLGDGRRVPIWVAPAEGNPKAVRLLRGGLMAQLQLGPQPLLSVDNVLQGARQTATGIDGGYLKVLEAARQEDGQIKLRVEMQTPPQVIPGVGPQGLGAGAA